MTDASNDKNKVLHAVFIGSNAFFFGVCSKIFNSLSGSAISAFGEYIIINYTPVYVNLQIPPANPTALKPF